MKYQCHYRKKHHPLLIIYYQITCLFKKVHKKLLRYYNFRFSFVFFCLYNHHPKCTQINLQRNHHHYCMIILQKKNKVRYSKHYGITILQVDMFFIFHAMQIHSTSNLTKKSIIYLWKITMITIWQWNSFTVSWENTIGYNLI